MFLINKKYFKNRERGIALITTLKGKQKKIWQKEKIIIAGQKQDISNQCKRTENFSARFFC